MKSRARPRFQPRLEALEARWVPSASALIVSPAAGSVAAISPANGNDHALPFKESLTITAVSDGVYTYEGNATHLGHVTAPRSRSPTARSPRSPPTATRSSASSTPRRPRPAP